MIKSQQSALWLLVVVMALSGLGIYRRTLVVIAEPVVSLAPDSTDGSFDLLTSPRPGRGRLDTVLAFDQADGFYFVTRKRDISYEKQVRHALHAAVINVLAVRGNNKRAVPLQRKDGRLARYLCDYLSVSPSGRRWWTVRRPYESPTDLEEGPSPKALLTAYDQDGKALQEWTLPQTVDCVRLVQAVGEDRVYVALDYVGHASERQQIWVYQVGQRQPQSKLPCPQLITSSGAFVTPDGKMWYLRLPAKAPAAIISWKLDTSPQVFAAFQKGFSGSPFWHEPSRGAFVYRHLTDNSSMRLTKEKAIYRVSPTGEIHKLFETIEVLPQRAGEQVRVGQPLKADEYFVWMEVEYVKDNKVTEYQIVKVPYAAR